MLGNGRRSVLGVSPEIRGEVLVGLGESGEGSLDEVLGGSGVTSGRGVAIINTSELQDLLGYGGTDNTSSTRSGYESDTNGSSLTVNLGGDGMDLSDLVTPIATTDRDEGELSAHEGTTDSNGDFLGDLDSETDVTVLISNNANSLKASSLSGLGLLLDGNDLHNLIGELAVLNFEEFINNLGFLDGDGVSVDFLKRFDVTVFNKTSEFGCGNPFVLGGTSLSATGSSTTATASESASSTAFSSFSWLVSHSYERVN